jgi:hypothetical protein
MKEQVINYLSGIATVRNHLTLLLNNARSFSREDFKILSEKIIELDTLFLTSLKLSDIPLGYKNEVNTAKKTMTFKNTTFDQVSKEEEQILDIKEVNGIDNSIPLPQMKDMITGCFPMTKENPEVIVKKNKDEPKISISDEDSALLKKRLSEEKNKLQKKIKTAKKVS